jgi:hypothetical protein
MVMQREEPLRDCREYLKPFWNIPEILDASFIHSLGFSEVFPPFLKNLP